MTVKVPLLLTRCPMQPEGGITENKKHKGGYLQYNEYIVYDVAQIRLRYLLRVGM